MEMRQEGETMGKEVVLIKKLPREMLDNQIIERDLRKTSLIKGLLDHYLHT